MNINELFKIVENIALKLPNVNDFSSQDIYTHWNMNEIKFSSINIGVESVTRQDIGTVYNCILYYGDRISESGDNINDIYNDSVTIINHLLNYLDEYVIEIPKPITYTLFKQKFADELAGCYCRLQITAESLNNCDFSDLNIFDNKYPIKNITVTKNGDFEYYASVEDKAWSGIKLSVDVPSTINIEPSRKVNIGRNYKSFPIVPHKGYDAMKRIELLVDVKPNVEVKDINIIENGDITIKPNYPVDGFSQVNIHTAVPQSGFRVEERTVDIEKNGTTIVNKSIGYDGMSKITINTAVPLPILTELNVNKNGKYISPEGEAYKTINVNVPTGTLGPIRLVEHPGMKLSNSTFTTFTNDEFSFEGVEDMSNMFSGCKNLTSIPIIDCKAAVNTANLFRRCENLTEIPMIDLGKSQDTSYLLAECRNITTIPKLNLSSAITTDYMFQACISLLGIPLLDISTVQSATGMFAYCVRFGTIPQLNTGSIKEAGYLFAYCNNLRELPLLDFSSVINLENAFAGCNMLTNVNGFAGLKTNINLKDSEMLTKESIMNIFREMGDLKKLGIESKTITLAGNVFVQLNENEKQIAIDKGWLLVS